MDAPATVQRRVWSEVGATPVERRLHLPRVGVDVRVQEVGDDARLARTLADALGGADLHLVPRAGHAPWLDAPGTCASLAGAFLTDPVAST